MAEYDWVKYLIKNIPEYVSIVEKQMLFANVEIKRIWLTFLEISSIVQFALTHRIF